MIRYFGTEPLSAQVQKRPSLSIIQRLRQIEDKDKVFVLFFHNSARSQIAEASWQPFKEIDTRLTAQVLSPPLLIFTLGRSWKRSASTSPVALQIISRVQGHHIIFELAVTVCDRAKQACPICSTQLELPIKSPKAREVIHRSREDPAAAVGSKEEQLKVFRQVMDHIGEWICRTFWDIVPIGTTKSTSLDFLMKTSCKSILHYLPKKRS